MLRKKQNYVSNFKLNILNIFFLFLSNSITSLFYSHLASHRYLILYTFSILFI